MGKRFLSGQPQFPTTLHHSNSAVVQHVANPGSTKMTLMILVSEVIKYSVPSEYGAFTGVTRNRPGQVLSPPPQDHSLDPIQSDTNSSCMHKSKSLPLRRFCPKKTKPVLATPGRGSSPPVLLRIQSMRSTHENKMRQMSGTNVHDVQGHVRVSFQATVE
jgi:hypothetical protein